MASTIRGGARRLASGRWQARYTDPAEAAVLSPHRRHFGPKVRATYMSSSRHGIAVLPDLRSGT